MRPHYLSTYWTKKWNLIGGWSLTWTKEYQKGFDSFNHLVKWFTVQNRLELGLQLPTHTLILLMKCCQFFRNYMCNVTHHNPFGSGLTSVNEVCKRIFYIFDDIYFSFIQIYMIYCGSWLSYVEAKYQSSLWISPPLVAATYCASIYFYTIKLLLLVISYYCSFSYALLKYWNIRDVKARREIMIPASFPPQLWQ